MLNLSATAPSHAYACRTGASSNIVVSPHGDMRHHLSGSSARTAVGLVSGGGLELLEQGFAGINSFRNNRFQYEIPTVGQHYGNAFNVGDDDEDDELPETIIDQQHDASATISEAESIADSGTQYLDDLLEEQYLDEDEDEDDVQMSPAVEVISIDPNCNYDTDEDGNNVEEHKVSLTVAMTPAMRSRSGSTSSCSTTSKRSSAQSNDDSSSEEQEDDGEESSTVDCGAASDVGTFNVPNFERPPQQLLAAASVQRPPHGRRKRSSHSQRQSFSMPHSPVGAGELDCLLGNLPVQTSFSFEDLDSIVGQYSPIKRSTTAPATDSTTDDDDLVDELVEDAANFDLTAYITGEDESSTSCDVVVGFHNENKRSKIDSAPSNGPRKTLPKSKGKEIQALRMLMMLPDKHADKQQPNDLQHSTKTGTVADVVNQRGGDHEKLPEKRSCTAKVKRILAPEDSGSDSGEDDEKTFSKSLPHHVFAKERRSARNAKRKAVDDTEKDPTWNPNGVTVHRPTKAEPKLHTPKSSATNGGTTGSTSSSQSNVETNGSKISSTTTNVKCLKFGADNTAAKPKGHTVVPTAASQKTVSREHAGSSKKDVLRKKTNVKLDHDYCSPKHVGQGGGARNLDGSPGGNGLRRTIEIPFLLPTKEQQRQKRKLLKDKKRNERTQGTKGGDSHHVEEPADNGGEDKQTKLGGRITEGDSLSASAVVMVQKQKTVLSGEQPTPGTASSLSSPSSSRSSSAVRSVACMRSNVNTLAVSKTGIVGVGGASANLVQRISATVATESPIVSAPPNASTGGCVKRPQQISLLKINQTVAKSDTSHVSVPAVDASSAQKGRSPQSTSSVVVSPATTESPCDPSPQSSTSTSTGEVAKEVVVVRKKLNLQEYKKRREHPSAGPSDSSSSTGNNGYSSSVNGNNHSLAVVTSTGTETSTNTPLEGDVANGSADTGGGGISAAAPHISASMTSSQGTGIFKATPEGAAKLKALAIAGRLDPITAAQQKALRMQQLKKEAAIKSNEAKINLKTMPLRPIVPLAEITRLQFDESGNPVPVGETNGDTKNDDRDASTKLHDDYEEIIIVSIGCNTAVSIAPVENDSDSMHQHQSMGNAVAIKKESNAMTEEASLLAANLSDTVKRCGLPSVQKMSGSTLIESIQEMVIKKSNTKPPTTNTASSTVNSATAATKTVQACKDDVPCTEKAVTLKKDTRVGGACGDTATGDQKAQYLGNQYSPYVGVSPPSSFSPGKPERAHISNSQAATDVKQQRQHHKVKSITIKQEEPTISIDRTTEKSSASVETMEHGEDKVIMHLRKDRQRSQRADVGVQTEPSSRFPPLQKLSAAASGGVPAANGSCPKEQQPSERAHSSSRQYGGSDEESDVKRRSGSRSKVRAKYSKDRSHSRHRSTVRHSSSSGSRSRSRSGCYSRAHREDDRRQRSKCSRSASRSSGRYSRSRRRSSRTSSRSSRSSCYGGGGDRCSSAGDRRSLSSSSSTSSMSSSGSTREGRHSGRRPSHSRSRSRSRSRMRLSTSPDHRNHHHSRELPVYRRQPSPERKIVYVGKLEANIHKEDLQKKFEPYGNVLKVTLHTKDNGCRYGFVTYEKPQQAYHAIDSSATDPALKDYDVSFGGRRAFCRTQYADLDGELSVDQDYQMPYFALESPILQRPSPIMNYSSSMCHAESLHGHGRMPVRGGGGGGGDTFEDLLMQFKKGIGAMKPRKI